MKLGEVWGKIELYIISLWFLFFLIIVVTIKVPVSFGGSWQFIGFTELLRTNIVPFVSSFFLLVGIISYSRFNYMFEGGSQNIPDKIVEIEDVNYEHLTFLTTYIIPLICFNLGSTRYVIALALLLVVIGIMYVKTDKFYANPTLSVLGYHIYKVTMEGHAGEKNGVVLISRGKLALGDQVSYKKLDKKVYFVRKR